ncbi:transposase [Clostridium sp. UBA1056]|uniref:transposase n=1 Tax=unclassified Clostridium TaxID=2614128 RepID=UPI003216D8B9
MNTVRKIKLIINTDDDTLRKEQYKFIRDSQYSQYQGLNRCMSYLMTGYYSNNMDIKSEGFKEYQKTITNSLYIFNDIEFGKGIDSKSSITQKVKKDFSASLKNGLAKGERSSTNYKRTFPLMTRGRDLKFKYDDDGIQVLINWINKIQFKCILGEHKNALELQHTLHKVIIEEYKVGQSSLAFDRNNKLILNLTLNIPNPPKTEVIKDRVCGVDLGMAVPAYCSLSDSNYIRKSFGTFEEFAKVRKQFKARRIRLQKQLQASKGGKGRKDKLKAREQLRDKEKNFAKTYNHFLSYNIVKFAKDHQCEYINLENITGTSLENTVLGMWSYYQLQEMIEYKAERVGIKVRYINPAFTSQKCSKCGNIDKENRLNQSTFICKNCGLNINADYNASLNIARSSDFKK